MVSLGEGFAKMTTELAVVGAAALALLFVAAFVLPWLYKPVIRPRLKNPEQSLIVSALYSLRMLPFPGECRECRSALPLEEVVCERCRPVLKW